MLIGTIINKVEKINSWLSPLLTFGAPAEKFDLVVGHTKAGQRRCFCVQIGVRRHVKIADAAAALTDQMAMRHDFGLKTVKGAAVVQLFYQSLLD
jgi:hypothetical protein